MRLDQSVSEKLISLNPWPSQKAPMGIAFLFFISCGIVAPVRQTNSLNLSQGSMDRREFVSGTAVAFAVLAGESFFRIRPFYYTCTHVLTGNSGRHGSRPSQVLALPKKQDRRSSGASRSGPNNGESTCFTRRPRSSSGGPSN